MGHDVPLDRAFFGRPALRLAPALLGRWILRQTADGTAAGIIVEVEAYGGPEDRASHARAGRTRRTQPMFGPEGHAYVYLIYGLHRCLNIVSDEDGRAGAVLIRALAPITGIDLMRTRRGRTQDPVERLAAGPARVCQALAIDRDMDGQDLTLGESLWLTDPSRRDRRDLLQAGVVSGPRIGVAHSGTPWSQRPWRFGVRGHPSLSRSFPNA